jgi:hypothetical protein
MWIKYHHSLSIVTIIDRQIKTIQVFRTTYLHLRESTNALHQLTPNIDTVAAKVKDYMIQKRSLLLMI